MKLQDAIIKLEPIINKKLGELLSESDMVNIVKAKGKTGQLLEILLGLENSSKHLDFEDGELKTNKCDALGNPLETMFITQISSIIDELLDMKSFYETSLYQKIENLLYVPICKEGEPKDWFFLPYVHVDLREEKFKDLKLQLEDDYYNICKQLRDNIENSADGYIHTSSGKYIQVRSKDSKPYSPIYSEIYRRYVSNKNHAFYFKKEFMRYINPVS
ncbi:MAG: DNA mismatch repair protein MutH [Tissierellia bacterium]|nr:DNA mismatch repair protein MutH [Tissierellia bacterium]